MKIQFLVLCSVLFAQAQSFSKDSEQIIPYSNAESADISGTSSAEIFSRTQAVLNYYKVPPEVDTQPNLDEFQGLQSLSKLQSLLKYFDPSSTFLRLANFSKTNLSIFQDIDSKQIVDGQLKLNSENPLEVRNQENFIDANLPLKGLKIALDPGHMGGTFWDGVTGKYVTDSKGNRVSEGVIALQTSLLLKQELQKLGAEVLVTHEGLNPVSQVDYKNFDLKPYALYELRDSIHSPWFLNLVSKYPAGSALYKAFDDNSNLKKLFSDNSRDDYFIRRADLWARAEMINQFKADLVLIIHYDTDEPADSSTGLNPNAPKQTKAFVVGSYQSNELASRAARTTFVRHIANQKSWDQSLKLSRSIVQKLHSQLGLSLAINADQGSTPIEPGILSRNLLVSRLLNAPAISYLECLFYNNPEEFQAFRNASHPMTIDGQSYPYSDRTVQVVQALRDGILDFAKSQ